jgi:O-antigen biosynthesis alpha-1,2-mannosyltransferase
MRIVVDLQGAQTGSRFRGIGRYSIALAQAIARRSTEHDVWITLNGNFPESTESLQSAFGGLVPDDRIVTFRTLKSVAGCEPADHWRRRASECVREGFLAELNPDVVHVSSLFEGTFDPAVVSVGRLGLGKATAVTQYDLIPLLNPAAYLGEENLRRWYSEKLESLKRADLLLAISAYAQKEALESGHFAPEQVVNISSACAPMFKPLQMTDGEESALMARYGIRSPFVMYSGAFDARKNLDRLVEAFALMPADLRAGHQLVLVGRTADAEKYALQHLAEKLRVGERVVFAGHVPDDDLVGLFNRCAVFVFPSLHEGFGLPALEAMACGAPTVGSDRTSIPEVIGRDDALFDPTSSRAISEKIARVLADSDFSRSLRQHGLHRSASFSWDAVAERTLDAFEALAAHSGSRLVASGWSAVDAARRAAYESMLAGIAAVEREAPPGDDDLADLAVDIACNRELSERIARRRELPTTLNWRIEGPFDSSYSLALLNRETARALSSLGHQVALHSTEGPGDFDPDPRFLAKFPDIAELNGLSETLSASQADVTSRNLYPPRVSDMSCRLNLLHHFAWEESGFPSEWVAAFNLNLQGITCLSNHVQKVLIDHGVTVPLSVSGCGVDHWERIEPDTSFKVSARRFRFLHVSSCFPRKGADALVEAFGAAFRSADDVTLIIKTFPNPHNEIHRWLAEARQKYPDYPDVVVIEDDLTDAELKALYQQCHALVAPSRAEGFGLPLAEAMLTGLAVITTGWSGQTDFCNDETAWLVDYHFEPARTHFGLFHSVWAAPDVPDLARAMREVHSASEEGRIRKAEAGRSFLLGQFRWQQVAQRLVDSARHWSRFEQALKPRIGWISTYNTQCGIGTYSEHLIDHMPDEVTVLAAETLLLTRPDGPGIVRCWKSGQSDRLDDLRAAISARGCNVLVVQFNYGFFEFEQLDQFLREQIDLGRVVVMMLHSTTDPAHVPEKRLSLLNEAMRRCHRILVHAVADMNRLKLMGVVDNVTLFPHGVNVSSRPPQSPRRSLDSRNGEYMVASYGFFLPHKGLLELIEAVHLLRMGGVAVRLKMVNAEYPIETSAELIREASRLVERLGLASCVELQTRFLTDEESLERLSEADLLVFPYQETGESASGAVRYGLSTGVPVAVTPLQIFQDVESAVSVLPGFSPTDIASGIRRLLQSLSVDSEANTDRARAAATWREAHAYSKLARRLHGMLTALTRFRERKAVYDDERLLNTKARVAISSG